MTAHGSEAESRQADAVTQRTVVAGQDARQGVTGHNVRYMLGFGLAAAVIVFAIIWLAYFA